MRMVAPKRSARPLASPPKFKEPVRSFNCPRLALQSVYARCTAPHPTDAEDRAHQRAFYVNDMGTVKSQYERWCRNIPLARPFYAMKCNPDPMLVQLLANLGSGFDCASAAEIDAALATGVKGDDIIFANPVKNAQSLQHAAKVGVKKMTFDNADELHKIRAHHPQAELVLRILADDSHSLMRFGTKFGSPFDNVEGLLRLAKELDLKVIGVAFHIGSGCFNTKAYTSAVQLARTCFDVAERIGLPRMTLLDIGGGFPGDPHSGPRADGHDKPTFEDMAATLCQSFAEYLPADRFPDLRIIGEPGRYFAAAWATLFTHVVGKRKVQLAPSSDVTDDAGAQAKDRFLYYINDGVYGSFNCLVFDHAIAKPIPAKRLLAAPDTPEAATPDSESLPLGTFFGPTCDSMDVVAKEDELRVGEWVAFECMGAYTSAAATTFNGIELPIREYVDSRPEYTGQAATLPTM